MCAPLVETEQHGSIRIQDLTPVVMGRRRLGLAEERLVPFEATGNVADADDCPGAFHRSSAVRLNRRFRSAQALTIEPRPIEAANASLPGSEHRAGIFDPTRASLWLLGGHDPVDPISARNERDVRPQGPRLRGGRESVPQICRHLGFHFLSRRCDLQGDDVACVCARSFAHFPVHFEPVASLAVRLERGPKVEAIDRAFDRRHAPGGELRTGVPWQGKKGPGAGVRGCRRPEEFRTETDLRSGSGHFCLVVLIGICFVNGARFARSTMSDSMLMRQCA